MQNKSTYIPLKLKLFDNNHHSHTLDREELISKKSLALLMTRVVDAGRKL